MEESARLINAFLVDVFGEVLRTEARALSDGAFRDLSLSELHVLEAVSRARREGRNRASEVARRLQVTAGTLTTSVKALSRKGYLLRAQDPSDRRVKRLTLTERGQAAVQAHAAFHAEMVRGVLRALSPEEAAALARGLQGAARFFREARLHSQFKTHKGEKQT